MAIRIHNVLSNGMGGINWAGLDLWVAHLGIADLQGLLWRLETIVNHRAPEDQARITAEEE